MGGTCERELRAPCVAPEKAIHQKQRYFLLPQRMYYWRQTVFAAPDQYIQPFQPDAARASTASTNARAFLPDLPDRKKSGRRQILVAGTGTANSG